MRKMLVLGLVLGLILVLGLVVMLSACGSTEETSTTAGVTTTVGSATTAGVTTSVAQDTTTVAATTGVIKIGHIRPLTGSMAATSEEMVKAFDWAFEQVGYTVAGKKIEIVVGDSKGDAQVAVDVAKKMVEKDKVALVVGPIQGGELMPVADYMNKAGVPHLSTTQVPPPIVINKMKWTINAGGTEPQSASAMATYAYDTLKMRKVIVLTGDYTPGHGFLDAFMNTFKAKGGEIVQEIYTPVPTQDFSPYLTTLKEADAVAAWVDGDQAVKLLTQYHEFGIDKKMPIIAASWGAFIAPYILGGMSAEAADATIGLDYIPTSYSPLTDFAFNVQWVKDFKAKFGFTPEDTSAGAYLGAQCIIEALKLTNGDTDPEKLREALLAVKFDSPFGAVSFDATTQVRNMNMNICQVTKEGTEYMWKPIFTYTNIPALGY
jgi:branched-chain amino acid transport system substrate-binding protein